MPRFILLLLLAAVPALAEPLHLLPPASRVELRAYGFGLVPLDGTFTRFYGWIHTDPANPKACQVVLEIEAASLDMSRQNVRDGIAGPEFMDTTRFPDLAFHGACEGDKIAGSLLLHGETHPFSLDFDTDRSASILTISGRLHRADWGMTARPFTVGSTVRIRFTFPNPAKAPQT
jgi:polyisoprenoid-binding protein YceI